MATSQGLIFKTSKRGGRYVSMAHGNIERLENQGFQGRGFLNVSIAHGNIARLDFQGFQGRVF
jgi:hypothetical protein